MGIKRLWQVPYNLLIPCAIEKDQKHFYIGVNMPTGVTYENLDVLDLGASASYINCTFDTIRQINVKTNTFSGCSFTAVSKMEGAITSMENCSVQTSNVLATNPSSRVGVNGTVSFTDSFFEAVWRGGNGLLLGGFQVNPSASLYFTRGHFLGQCHIPTTASNCRFISSDVTGARIAGSQYCTVLMDDCIVDCNIGGYLTLTDCTANKELTIGDISLGLNDSVTIDGGSFAQINARVGNNCSILPAYLKKVIYSGTPNDSALVGCSNFWGGACLPELTGTGNTVKNLKGIDFVKRERYLGADNVFENVSSVTLPRSVCTVKGTIKKCDASKLAKDSLIGTGDILGSDFSYTQTNPADGGPVNVKDNTTFEYASTNCTLFFSGTVRNISLRESSLYIMAPSTTFLNCDLRGTSLLSGNLSNSVFKDCLLEGLNTGSTMTTGWDISESTDPGDPYTPQLNLLEGSWVTYDDWTTYNVDNFLSRTINPGESFAIAAKSSDPLYAFGSPSSFSSGLPSPSFRILGYREASSLSTGRAKVSGGLLPNSLTKEELDSMSILTGNVSEINTALTSLVSNRYYILLQNLSDVPQTVYALPVNDIPSLSALGFSFPDMYLMRAASAYKLIQAGAIEEELLEAGATPEELVFPFALDESTLMAWEFQTAESGAPSFPDLSGNGYTLFIRNQGSQKYSDSKYIGSPAIANNTSEGWAIDRNIYGIVNKPHPNTGSEEWTYEMQVTLYSNSENDSSLISTLGYWSVVRGLELALTGALASRGKVRVTTTDSGGGWHEAFTNDAVPLGVDIFLKAVLKNMNNGTWAVEIFLNGALQEQKIMNTRPIFNPEYYLTVGRRSVAWTGESTIHALIKAASISITARDEEEEEVVSEEAGGTPEEPGGTPEEPGGTPEEPLFPFALDGDTLMAWDFSAEDPGVSSFPDLSGNDNHLLVRDQGVTTTGSSRIIGTSSTADNSSAGWDITWDKYGVATNPFVDEGSELTYEVLVTLQNYARASNGEASLVSMLGEDYYTYGVEMTVRGTGLSNASKVRSVTKSGSWVEAYTTAAVPLETEVTIKTVLRDAGSGNWALATYLDGVLQNEKLMSSRPEFNADFYPTVGRRSNAWTGESTTNVLIKAVSISKTARL